VRSILTLCTRRMYHFCFAIGRKFCADKPSRTMTPEWKEKTREMSYAWPREGAGPVELNPIRHRRQGEPTYVPKE